MNRAAASGAGGGRFKITLDFVAYGLFATVASIGSYLMFRPSPVLPIGNGKANVHGDTYDETVEAIQQRRRFQQRYYNKTPTNAEGVAKMLAERHSEEQSVIVSDLLKKGKQT